MHNSAARRGSIVMGFSVQRMLCQSITRNIMRALSLLSLVVVLAIVAMLVRTQLRASHQVEGAAAPASATASLPTQIQTDLNKMMDARPEQLNREMKDGQP